MRKTVKVLKLTADDVDSNAPAAETVRRMLMNLATLTQGSAELRNSYGTGHGKSSARQSRGLTGRHARLAVGAAATLGAFLYETYEERLQTAARDLSVPTTPRES